MAAFDIVKSRHGIVELFLRGIFIVLSLCSAVCASAYFGALSDLCNYMTTFHAAHTDVVIGTCDTFKYQVVSTGSKVAESLSFDSKSSVGWILALSFVAFIYQILAVLQLFLDFEMPNMKKVLCKHTCTIFFLTDVIALGLFSFGYFCGGVSAALLASGSWARLPAFYRGALQYTTNTLVQVYAEIANYISGSNIHSTCATTATFSLLLMIFCAGLIVHFIIVRFVLKSPTHGTEHISYEEVLESK